MANPFDQFDAPAAPSRSVSGRVAQANPFDKFDDASSSAPELEGLGTDIPRAVGQFGAGFNSSLKGIISAPGDLTGWALSKIPGLEHLRGAGSRATGAQMDALGIDPDAENLKPRNMLERAIRGTGEGVGAAMIPEAAVAGLGRAGIAAAAPRVAEGAETMFGASRTAGAVAANATVGGVGGATGEVAADLVPEDYKDAARLAGNLVGGGAAAVGTSLGGAAVRNIKGPRWATEAGREALAVERLGESSSRGRAGLMDALENDVEELVPGSRPTTAQMTGDANLLQAENTLSQTEAARPRFSNRIANNNEARVEAIEGIQPTGDPTAIPTVLQRGLNVIDQHTDDTIAQAMQQAQAEAARLRGTAAPEAIGDQLRTHLQGAFDAAKARSRAMWNAVDPRGRLGVSTNAVKEAADTAYGDLSGTAAAGLDGVERRFLGLIDGYGDQIALKELNDLRVELGSAISTAKAGAGFQDTPVTRRLAIMRGSIDRAIEDTINGRVDAETRAVAAGRLLPQDTLESRLQSWVDEYQASRAGRASGQGGGNPLPGPAGGSTRAAGAGGAESVGGPGRGSPRGDLGGAEAPGGAGSAPALDPVTPAARDRLRGAIAATREQKETFGSKTLPGQLTAQPQNGTYRVSSAAVPSRVWKAGDSGYEAAQTYMRATGNNAEAQAALVEAAHASARKAAMREDGTIDPTKFSAWRKSHASALRALPAQARDTLTSAARASEAMASAQTAKVAALKNAQIGAVGKFMKLEDHDDVVGAVGSILSSKTGVGQMKELQRVVAGNPEASQGLRRAVVEHIMTRFSGGTQRAGSDVNALQGAQLVKFINASEAKLRAAGFSDQHIGTMKAVARDIERASKSNATMVGGGSDTTGKLLPHLIAGQKSMKEQTTLLAEVIGATTGGMYFQGPPGAALGAAYGASRWAYRAVRDAGLAKVDDIVVEALLDPAKARALLRRVPYPPTPAQRITLSQQLRRVLAMSGAQATVLPHSEGAK